jgi:hypothetical protein
LLPAGVARSLSEARGRAALLLSALSDDALRCWEEAGAGAPSAGEGGGRAAAAELAALAAAFPRLRLVVHRRSASAKEAVTMFAAAAAVVGPHGAGLVHTLFCQPGTALVELVFLHSPPMMFWHMASAMRLRYAMVPLPRSFWAQSAKRVDVHEVVSMLRRLLDEPARGCAAGSAGADCAPCAVGTYAPDSWPRVACVPCQPGRVAPSPGAAHCRTCPDGERSVNGMLCERCPDGALAVLQRGGEVCVPMPADAAELRALLDEASPANASGALHQPLPAPELVQAAERLLYTAAESVHSPPRRELAELPQTYEAQRGVGSTLGLPAREGLWLGLAAGGAALVGGALAFAAGRASGKPARVSLTAAAGSPVWV